MAAPFARRPPTSTTSPTSSQHQWCWRCHTSASGALRWRICLDTGLGPDITIAVRMDEGNEAPRDFYLLPSIDITQERLRLGEDSGLSLDAYRVRTAVGKSATGAAG